MGAFDEAEVCELVGNFILQQAISKKNEKRYQQNIKQNTITTKNRKKNINCFNPPYSADDVVTKVGKHYLPLLAKTRHSKFYKIFNRNKVKINYNAGQI